MFSVVLMWFNRLLECVCLGAKQPTSGRFPTDCMSARIWTMEMTLHGAKLRNLLVKKRFPV